MRLPSLSRTAPGCLFAGNPDFATNDLVFRTWGLAGVSLEQALWNRGTLFGHDRGETVKLAPKE